MRSKEVENTIERLKNGKNTAYVGSNTAIYFIKDVETALSYIEELEKRDKAVLVYFDKEGNPIEYLNKQVIRDKIKELEELDLEIYETDTEDVRIAKYEQRAMLDMAREIIGE